ncbi:protogenin [Protopterus annectens]|uniref:protogenin n=1 Tax=Protopterus annectens TaxID=7888 RepID=UPI001CF9DFE2|nr:protogenin [Protopterus annectens]
MVLKDGKEGTDLMDTGILCFSELFYVREPQDVTVLRKDSVTLDCQARGEGPVTILWLKNGVKISENDRVYTLANSSLHISEVEVRRGDRTDEGFYQCLAQNKYGAILSRKARLAIASMSSFEMQPTSTVVQEGGVARFICRIYANPPPVITWEFNRTALPLAIDRIAVLSTGVLQIYGVKKSDAGYYRCVATNTANRRRSEEAIMTVNSAPEPKPLQKPIILVGPQNITASLHQTVILECVATGNPKPIISWSRLDHKSIDVFNTRVIGNGNLMISDVKVHHAGIYACRATTPGTRNFTVSMASLTVLAPPAFVEWPDSLTRPRAGTARFVCQAEGIPSPKVTWMKNGEKVHSNGRIKMYNSKLVINQIIPEDDAIYQCLAENDQGSILSMARLIVVMSEDRPSAPRNIRAETVSSSAILLAWERPLYNSEKVIAYSIHYMKAEGLNNEEYQVVIGNDTTRYIVDDLEPASNYTFYIVAYMPMGASRMSDHVVQHTLEDVPLRPPELSLTSRSPTDMLVSWLPIPTKFRRGHIVSYRIFYRSSSEGSIHTLELPGSQNKHLLEHLQPDSTYLVRIAAATRVGWGEPSPWTSHKTPKANNAKVPLAPGLHLTPLNCTTITVRWQLAPENTANIQGYKLYYREESRQESAPVFLSWKDSYHTIGGLDPRRKYHVRILAYNSLGDGYQADQTVSTPGCVSVRDRMEPPPPPPHHLHTKANSSSSIYLKWGKPAFTAAQTVNYTIRCNPVGLQNASLVMYLQTSDVQMLVQGLEPNTKYEFAVRLHVDHLSSPWSPVVYQTTLPEAPSSPPTNVKVTLIEENTALVSWKPPDETQVSVTRYTILYASRKDWIAGQWHMLHREGSITMALLENLLPGNVYLVQVSASNEVGDGPFSKAVELAVVPKENIQSGQSPKLSDARNSEDTNAFSAGYYNLDQNSMTGIIVGVCIALTCILICILILIYRGKARKLSSIKVVQENGQLHSPAECPNRNQLRKTNVRQSENGESLVPMIAESNHLDTKGGTDLIINNYGPVTNNYNSSRKKWLIFKGLKTKKEQPQRKNVLAGFLYQPGRTMLSTNDESPVSPEGLTSIEMVFSTRADTEYSHNSEGSQETGDSGRYSHDSNDETDMVHLSTVTTTAKSTSRYLVQTDVAMINEWPTCEEHPTSLAIIQNSACALSEEPSIPVIAKVEFPV